MSVDAAIMPKLFGHDPPRSTYFARAGPGRNGLHEDYGPHGRDINRFRWFQRVLSHADLRSRCSHVPEMGFKNCSRIGL